MRKTSVQGKFYNDKKSREGTKKQTKRNEFKKAQKSPIYHMQKQEKLEKLSNHFFDKLRDIFKIDFK